MLVPSHAEFFQIIELLDKHHQGYSLGSHHLLLQTATHILIVYVCISQPVAICTPGVVGINVVIVVLHVFRLHLMHCIWAECKQRIYNPYVYS